jgi:hypothetical protein
VGAVREDAGHYHKSPDQLSEEDLRLYFLYLANEKKVARGTATVALCTVTREGLDLIAPSERHIYGLPTFLTIISEPYGAFGRGKQSSSTSAVVDSSEATI